MSELTKDLQPYFMDRYVPGFLAWPLCFLVVGVIWLTIVAVYILAPLNTAKRYHYFLDRWMSCPSS